MSLQTPTGQPALWQVMEKHLPTQRKRRLCLRQVSNAIFYILRPGRFAGAMPVAKLTGLLCTLASGLSLLC
ncbi:transposase [Fibrisoma montanum]|uniref:Transposase n=1 Tax=Fibrisoma montanum TaxID=2305895 RepID=A0A418M0T8_9BACT|nr:transposase [Fibrisoma montanum]